MSLSRKNYVKVAEILKKHSPESNYVFTEESRILWGSLMSHLTRYFEEDNERFDVERFTKACGM